MQRYRSPAFFVLSMDSIKLLWDTFLDRVRQETVEEGAHYKKRGRSFTGAIIGPFSTGVDQSRPFNPEASGATTESYRAETSESQCTAGESEKKMHVCVCAL